MVDDIQMRVIQAADHDRVLAFLRLHYYPEEPLTVGREPKQQDAQDEEYNMGLAKHGTSLMAVHVEAVSGAEKVVGVVLAGPKTTDEAEHLFEEWRRLGPTKWGKIVEFLAHVERDSNVYERYGVPKAVHASVLSVDASLRGRALGARLMKELFALSKKQGYPLVTVDCTSVYSAQLSAKLGMELVWTVYYKDFADEQGTPVFNPPAPHDCVKTYAKLL